jgi:creatinine amidohydrolase
MKLFAELNREQLKAASDAVVILPLGATEQHGPHLPTGTDTFQIELVAREAAQLASERVPVIVTPTLPFGSSHHHFVFGGTLSFSTETYYRILRDLVESLVTDGFTKIFLLNGHGGNHELVQLAARDVILTHNARVAAGSFWLIAWRALAEAEAARGLSIAGHAGQFESSLMLSLRPDLVQQERPTRENLPPVDMSSFEAPWRHEQHGWWKSMDGYTDNPAAATAETGTSLRKVIVESVAQSFVDFYNNASS